MNTAPAPARQAGFAENILSKLSPAEALGFVPAASGHYPDDLGDYDIYDNMILANAGDGSEDEDPFNHGVGIQ